MQNKYPKLCAKCGVNVPAYEGVCEKVNNSWIVEHVDCHTPDPAILTAKAKLEQIQAKGRGLREAPPPIEVREFTGTAHPAFASIDAFDYWK